MTVTLVGSSSPIDEDRLAHFGLSTDVFHAALQPGVERARNRSSKALRTTPGTDIYHDSMERLHQLLSEAGWTLIYVDQQPRLLHPEDLMALTIASARNVGPWGVGKTPRTGRKGKATRNALAAPSNGALMLFGNEEAEHDMARIEAVRTAPLWMLVHERTPQGLNLELCRPSLMTLSGSVTGWAEQIPVGPLVFDGDFSVFDDSDHGSITVDVQPR